MLAKKYNSKKEYSEEYYRIKLIKYLLKKGIDKKQFFIEYIIRIGHKGNNFLRVDLVVKDKRQKKVIIVSEVKQCYTTQGKHSAIKHQLEPAMKLLNNNFGIYYDGSEHSCIIKFDNKNQLTEKKLII